MKGKTICIIITVVVIGGLVCAAILLTTSLKRLDSFEVGLKYDTVWKALAKDPTNQGLYPGPPGYKFLRFPSVFKTLEFTGLVCLNNDGAPITLNLSYQYRARPNDLHTIVKLFGNQENYQVVLKAAASAAVHEACSQYNTSQFQAQRGLFQETVGVTLAKRSDPLFCDVSEIQIKNIARPGEYEGAVQDKEAAKENIKVSENERPRLITEAETLRRQAETQAEITIAKAESQARIKLARAEASASAILREYDTEALTYETLRSNEGLSLSDDAFMSYMGIRTISNAKQPVYIGLKSPAKTSYVKV